MNINSELLNIYVENGVIKKSDALVITETTRQTGESPIEYLYKNYDISESDRINALGSFYCMPHIELTMLSIDKTLMDNLSIDYLKKHRIMPIMRTDDNSIIIAISDPYNLNSLSAIRSVFGENVDFFITTEEDIDKLFDSISAQESMTDALSAIHKEDEDNVNGQQKDNANSVVGSESLAEETVDNPSVRLVDSIIKEAIPSRASDIHIEPFEKFVRVRYRIDGDLVERATFPSTAYPSICARLKILSGINIAERRIPQDGRINMMIGDIEYDFRVSTLPSVHGEKFVIRILDKTSFKFTREDLGYTPEESIIIDKMINRPHGIVLLTGPTGCGKSTTLYSFLKEINKPEVNVVTVEDPVEYTMEGITQTQVNTKANMTFAAALRSILRQDPDVIMIGEIRDEETAEIAVRAAITGHLVFSTLHTNDAPGSISRLKDMKIPAYLLADSLDGVIAQRLVKRLCPACKKKAMTTPEEMKILGIKEPIEIYHPQGCQYCNHTGYKGRTAVHEIMFVNSELRAKILSIDNPEEFRKLCIKNGMISLWDSCLRLVKQGQTSISELLTLNIE